MTMLQRSLLDAPQSTVLPYKSLDECLHALAGIEAIDFFFAQYTLSLCESTEAYQSLSKAQISLSFHVLLALSFAQRQGNSCLPIASLSTAQMWTLSSNYSDPGWLRVTGYQFPSLMELQEYLVMWEQIFAKLESIILDEGRLYTAKFYEYETQFCQRLLDKMQNTSQVFLGGGQTHDQEKIGLEKNIIISEEQQENLLKLWPILFPTNVENPKNSEEQRHPNTDWQQLAVMNSLMSQFSIISGGAGTGKTFTVSRLLVALIRVFNMHPRRIGLVAPTGKAANRLASSLQEEIKQLSSNAEFYAYKDLHTLVQVQTIHRLLKIHPIDGRTKYDQYRPLAFDCLILDEASMVDLTLMHKLLRATNADCKVIMVGDPNQLPSVEAGCLLADLVASTAALPSLSWVEYLSSINQSLTVDKSQFQDDKAQLPQYLVKLRQGKRSNQAINDFADAVLQGKVDEVIKTANEAVTLNIDEISFQQGAQFNQILLQNVMPRLLKSINADSLIEGWNALTEYACLIPNRKGFAGVAWVNAFIEQALSRRFAWIELNQAYRGKPIMITQNDYNLGLFNGDIGIIWPDAKGELWAYFPTDEPEQFQPFSLYTLPSFDAVYAMTIHKTQGSEYQHVDIILPSHSAQYLTRELLYTGVTRAKTSLNIFADEQTLKAAISQKVERVSGIESRLKSSL